jgi:hypothetical protein
MEEVFALTAVATSPHPSTSASPHQHQPRSDDPDEPPGGRGGTRGGVGRKKRKTQPRAELLASGSVEDKERLERIRLMGKERQRRKREKDKAKALAEVSALRLSSYSPFWHVMIR